MFGAASQAPPRPPTKWFRFEGDQRIAVHNLHVIEMERGYIIWGREYNIELEPFSFLRRCVCVSGWEGGAGAVGGGLEESRSTYCTPPPRPSL